MLPSPISIGTSARPGAEAGPASGLTPGEGEARPQPVRSTYPRRIVVALIRGYQLAFSPVYAGSCRYVPSCSAYAIEAVERFGALKGGWLALKRLSRCHPLGGHGLDPVPGTPESPKGKTVNF